MSKKTRYQIKSTKKLKRKKRRQKLAKQKLNPDDFFYNGFWVKKV